MKTVAELFRKVPLWLLVLLCLTLGLAPFKPEPHLLQKLGMLAAGELGKPVDVLDLLLHAAPWLLLIIRLVLAARDRLRDQARE